MQDNKHIKCIRAKLLEYGVDVPYSGEDGEEYVRSLEEQLAWAQYEIDLKEESIGDLQDMLNDCCGYL